MDLNKLSSQLVKHEGLRLKPYVDTVGKITIGVGHNLTDNGLTPNQVTAILQDDITNVVTFIKAHLPWVSTIDEVRQRVIGDLAFVMMGTLLTFHTMLAAMQAAKWDEAADALLASKFAAQTGQRAKNLAFMLRTGKDPL